MRGRIAVVVVLLAAAGCSAGGPASTPTRPTAPSASASRAVPTPVATPPCPAPPSAATAPTDFPHPPLTKVTPSAPPSADDQALKRQGLAALTTFGGPVATAAFQHYVDATGTYLPLPVDQLLAVEPALVADLDRTLVEAAGAAVTAAATAPACSAVPFASDWAGHADPVDAEWRYTLGRFYARVLGAVTREPSGSLRVSYRAAIGDTYDFDPGSTFAEFARLADDGHAAVFLDGGLTTPRTATVTSAAELGSPGFGAR